MRFVATEVALLEMGFISEGQVSASKIQRKRIFPFSN